MGIIKLYHREANGTLRYRHYVPKGPRGRAFTVLTGKVGGATSSLRAIRVPDRDRARIDGTAGIRPRRLILHQARLAWFGGRGINAVGFEDLGEAA